MASFYPSRLLAVGIAPETVLGDGSVPVWTVPVNDFTPGDNVVPMPDQAWRGLALDSYGYSPGTADAAISLGGPLFTDSIGFALEGILPSTSHAGVSRPFTWEFASRAAQPKSFAITKDEPSGVICWPGCVFTRVQIDFDTESLLTWSADLIGRAGVAGSGSAPAPQAALPIPSWQGVVTLAGVASALIIAGSVVFTAAGRLIRNNDGSRAPYNTWSGVTAVSGSFTALAKNDNLRTDYVNGTQASIDLNWEQGAGTALQGLQVHCLQAVWTKVAYTYGSSWVQLDVEWSASANTSDVVGGAWSPALVTLTNDIAPGLY